MVVTDEVRVDVLDVVAVVLAKVPRVVVPVVVIVAVAVVDTELEGVEVTDDVTVLDNEVVPVVDRVLDCVEVPVDVAVVRPHCMNSPERYPSIPVFSRLAVVSQPSLLA